MHINENTQNSHRFLAIVFFRGICLGRHKILRFLVTLIDIFHENFFGVMIALFENFKSKCEKNCTVRRS
jgi:hypothetical protein